MRNTLYAIVAAALIAAGITLAPSLSLEVEAGAPAPDGKSDRADMRPVGDDCSEKTWPYVEAACLRDARNPLGQAREVRFVSMGTPGAPRRPPAKPQVAAKLAKPIVASR